jgi:hypothetical protein
MMDGAVADVGVVERLRSVAVAAAVATAAVVG